MISGVLYGSGTGPNLGAAKKAAAKEALEKLAKEGCLTVCAIFHFKTEV